MYNRIVVQFQFESTNVVTWEYGNTVMWFCSCVILLIVTDTQTSLPTDVVYHKPILTYFLHLHKTTNPLKLVPSNQRMWIYVFHHFFP